MWNRSPRLRQWYDFLWKRGFSSKEIRQSLCNSYQLHLTSQGVNKHQDACCSTATCNICTKYSPYHPTSPLLTQVTLQNLNFTQMNRSLDYTSYFTHIALFSIRKNLHKTASVGMQQTSYPLVVNIDIRWNFLPPQQHHPGPGYCSSTKQWITAAAVPAELTSLLISSSCLPSLRWCFLLLQLSFSTLTYVHPYEHITGLVQLSFNCFAVLHLALQSNSF